MPEGWDGDGTVNARVTGWVGKVNTPVQTENLPLFTVFQTQLLSIPSFCYSQCVCVCACVRACVCFHIIPDVNCFGRTVLYVCI